MQKTIKFYKRLDEYGFLSNFWRSEQTFNSDDNTMSITFPTNEHFYQTMKAKDLEMQIWIANAPKAYHAMCAGRSLRTDEINENWDNMKVAVMLIGLRAKFENETLKKKLLETGDAILMEDSPTDMFWGGTLPGSKNMLGKLLMKVREELRESKAKAMANVY